MASEIEAKLEEIKLKNDELERKHKEKIEDELQAKMQGAQIDIKELNKVKEVKHRYDDVDLDFDVKIEQKEHAKNPDYKPKNRRPITKKQLDEMAPPPDPVNFLREDNEEKSQTKEPNQSQRPKRNNESSFRQRNQNPRSRNYTSNSEQNQQHQAAANQTSPRKIHPQQLRNERRTAGNFEEANDKNKGQAASQNYRPRRANNANSSNNNENTNRTPQKPNKDNIGEKNDLTVHVTDEVRSVKLKSSEKTFGTGRVGRQENLHKMIRNDNFNSKVDNDLAESGDSRKNNKNNANRSSRSKRDHYQKKPNGPNGGPHSEFQHPILDKIVISKTSVQERLMRSKMIGDNENVDLKIEDSAQTSPEINN